jgi:integrase/recombinase XerD
MAELLDRMLMDMELRNYSPHTIKAYLWHARAFEKLFGKSAEQLGEQAVRQYLHYLTTTKGVSISNITIAYSSLKFLYVHVLERDWNVNKLPRAKKEKKLPFVLSYQEVKRLFDVVDNVKHRLMLMTTYSAGLRVSETANLKLNDIDSQRMQIRVKQGKGNKDRYTLLSEQLLQSLRYYWRIYRPSDFLFPGNDANKPINVKTIQRVMTNARVKAGIKKPATMHTLRHSFATHLLEQGVDIFTIQKLLGHSHIRTTCIYIHIQRKNIVKIINPLDQLLGDE